MFCLCYWHIASVIGYMFSFKRLQDLSKCMYYTLLCQCCWANSYVTISNKYLFDYVLCIHNRRTRNKESIKNKIKNYKRLCSLSSLPQCSTEVFVQVCKVNKHYVFQIHKTPKVQCYLKIMPSILKMSAQLIENQIHIKTNTKSICTHIVATMKYNNLHRKLLRVLS